MAILSRKVLQGEKGTRFTGVHIPRELNSYLALFSLASSKPKSTVLLDSLVEWKSNSEVEMSQDKLILMVVNNVKRSYNFASLKVNGKKSVFLQDLSVELLRKGLEEGVVKLIIKKLQDAADKK
jgi:hypothetical protein